MFAGVLAVRAFQKNSLTGQLIDIACYTENKANTGNDHKGRGLNCGQACALEGFPVGLLVDGKVYQVMGELTAHSNAKLYLHVGHTVTLAGATGDQGGHPIITATDIKETK